MSSEVNAILSEKDAIARLQSLDEVERRLSDTLIRMKTEFSVTDKELASLRSTAKEKFGTDDIAELRELYREGLKVNSDNIFEYEAKLSDAEKLINAASEQLKLLEQ